MKSVANSLMALLLMLAVAAPLSAADKKDKKEGKNAAAKKDKKKRKAGKKKRRRRGNRGLGFARQIMRQLAKVDLTAEQKKKTKEVIAKHKDKFAAVNKKRSVIFTKERRKARRDANKAARAEGKKGKELRAAINAAVKFTTEEKEKLKSINKEQRTLMIALRKDVFALLTAEQKEKLPKQRRRKGKKNKKPKKNKKTKKKVAESDSAK